MQSARAWAYGCSCPAVPRWTNTVWHFKHLLTELYPYRNYLYLGGHFRQGGTPGTASYNPVTYRMAEDMTTLCDRMLSGSAEDALYDSDKSFGPERAHIATYGTASMVYLPSQVH